MTHLAWYALSVACAVLVAGLLREALVTALTQGLRW